MGRKYRNLKFSVDEEGIALVTINRPEVLNALGIEVFIEIGSVFDELKENATRVVILTGEGEKAFASGADIVGMQNWTFLKAREVAMIIYRVQGKIESFPRPVIAAVNGYALGGGCELALACDIRLASSNAVFGQPEINLGLIPGGGGIQRLSRLVGISKAKEMVYTGDMIDAQRALKLGLVNKVVSPAELLPEARELASKIASKSLPILLFAKTAFNYGYNADLDRALQFEMEYFAACFDTMDSSEGIHAFVERRKPVFLDK